MPAGFALLHCAVPHQLTPGCHACRTYIARWQGSRVAVKCVELREREPEALPEYAQQAITGSGGSDPGSMALVEAVLSKALRHPHIVSLLWCRLNAWLPRQLADRRVPLWHVEWSPAMRLIPLFCPR